MNKISGEIRCCEKRFKKGKICFIFANRIHLFEKMWWYSAKSLIFKQTFAYWENQFADLSLAKEKETFWIQVTNY